nr:monooxygenase [uncultured Actinoplanes sp.]
MPVTLHVWRVPRRRIGAALIRMALSRRPANASFAKFVGTATGFRPQDGDLTRFAAVTVSDDEISFPRWDRIASQSCRVDLALLHSHGRWSGREPFGEAEARSKTDGMVVSITRARLRPAKALTFWRAIPPVVTELAEAPGLLAHFGMGEAPIGWQGTVSVWRHSADLTRFAYRQPEHRAVIARTPADRWYAEDLFARFAVRRISGDRSVLGWVADEEGETER